MRRLRLDVGRRCTLSLSLVTLLFQLMVMAVFLVLRRRSGGAPHGQFFNVDAGEKVCLQRPREELPPDQSADQPADQSAEQLVLAPCQSLGRLTDNSQLFRLDFEGRLLSQEELCVGSDLRLNACRGQQEIWVFTQGSGLVHVESSLCLTRDPGSRLNLRSCDNRPEQYWWYQLEGADPPV